MDITETISLLDELRGKMEPRRHPTQGEYDKRFIGVIEVWICPSCGLDEQWNVFYDGKAPMCTRDKERREYMSAVDSALPALRQAALDGERYKRAGEELANAIEAISSSRLSTGGDNLRHAALEAYRQAVEQKEV